MQVKVYWLKFNLRVDTISVTLGIIKLVVLEDD